MKGVPYTRNIRIPLNGYCLRRLESIFYRMATKRSIVVTRKMSTEIPRPEIIFLQTSVIFYLRGGGRKPPEKSFTAVY